MTWAFGIITVLYVILLLLLLYGYCQQPYFRKKEAPPATRFSIVVPFRNEAKNLPSLLNSLVQLNYPATLFEVFLVNDFSEDESESICRRAMEQHSQLQFHLSQNSTAMGSPKKNAITLGIKKATGDYILTTDADCTVPTEWLQEFNSFILETQSSLIAAPVRSGPGKGMWQSFEEIDTLSLQTASIGAFGINRAFLCNGGNLCYKKSAFLEMNGFQDNAHIASGDDIFLLEKFRAGGYSVDYLKSRKAVVSTKLQKDLKGLLSQRIRWAAKTTAYHSLFPKIVGLVLLLMNAGIIIVTIAWLLNLLPLQILIFPFLIKFNLDFIFMYPAAVFFRQEHILKNYFWCSLIYPFFSTYVAFLSLFKGYTWKGRQFRR